MCPICGDLTATVATVFYPRDPESGQHDASVILNCPTCGELIDGEIDSALPRVPVADEEEQEVCPI